MASEPPIYLQGPREPRKRPYLIPILLAVGFVLGSPVGLLIVFLAGDSCCGSNTTGAMAGIAGGIVVLMAGIATSVALTLKPGGGPRFSVGRAVLIAAGPATVIYVAVVAFISATAF